VYLKEALLPKKEVMPVDRRERRWKILYAYLRGGHASSPASLGRKRPRPKNRPAPTTIGPLTGFAKTHGRMKKLAT
jgi:hypothetical protein